MPFAEDVIRGVERLAFSLYRNPSDMAVKIKVSQPIISKLLARKSNPRMDILGRLLDALGARIVFPDEQRSTVWKAVVAAHGNMPDGERIPGNLNVVPMVSPGALRPGGVLPGEAVGWFVLNMDTVALRGRESIVGTVLERHHDALLPLVGPGDTAFVDTGRRRGACGLCRPKPEWRFRGLPARDGGLCCRCGAPGGWLDGRDLPVGRVHAYGERRVRPRLRRLSGRVELNGPYIGHEKIFLKN